MFRWFQVTFPSGRFKFVRADSESEARAIIAAEYALNRRETTHLKVRPTSEPIFEQR